MKILAKQNRELIMINAQNTQNENDAEKIILQVPEQYEDFNKKIVFITPDGNVWDIITNNEYLIKKAITKYHQVDFYIWLTKDNVDFRSQTKTLKFYHNVDASDEITEEEIGRVNTVINLLEEEITKVNNLETEIDGKLEEIDTAIDNVSTAIQETENLDLDAEKVGQTTTITLTKKDGTVKTVHVDDGVDLQFMWQGTSLGIKTAEQEEYTFVDLQGVQGQRGEQGEPFTIKKTYSSVVEMNADFNNMQLGDYVMIASTVEVEDNAKLYTRGENQWIFITDFSGATGIRGEVGLTPNVQIGTVTQGSSFNVTRTGTNENPILNFTLVKGDKGDVGSQGPVGATGNGIDRIEKTATVGNKDTYTIYFTNGSTTTYEVSNGEVTREELEEEVDRLSMIYNAFPTTTGEGEEVSINGTAEVPFKEIGLKGNTSQSGEPTPDAPIPVNVVTGDNSITIANSDNTQSQTYPINLGSIELCKIGDYQDSIVKDNGTWYLHKEIGKVVLDGSENWNNDVGTQGAGYRHNIYYAGRMSIPIAKEENKTYLSNYFVPQNIGYDSGNLGNFYMSSRWLVFVDKNKVYDLAQWKTWLSTHNVSVYYVLATPTIEEITDTTLIEQLDNLEKAYSYDTQTNISQTNQDKPFIISYEAILSLKNVLNDLETRIAECNN